MKLRTKRLFATLLTGVLATSMLFNDAVPVQAASTIQAATPYKYNTSDPLFAATHFHFFAKEYAEIKTHCHGNVAAKTFSAGSNSGSDKLGAAVKSEIFYFQNIDTTKGFNANFAGATVVLGAEIPTYTMNNAEVYLGSNNNGIKIEPNSTIYQETSTSNRFIDFDTEFDKLEKLSAGLAQQPSITDVSTGVAADFEGNKYKINLLNQNVPNAYVHIQSIHMANVNEFEILNIDDFTSGEAVIINYELPSGTTDYTLPFTRIIVQDSSGNLNSTETWGVYTGHGNILWNFYTIKNGVKTPYSGTLNTCSEFKGTILAPKATIKLASSNQDGNFIGTNVYGGGGQTHRWDFGGSLPRTFGSDDSIEDTDPTGALEIIVREAGTGTPIQGATVQISGTPNDSSETFTTVTYTTDRNGKLIVDASTDKTVLDNLLYGNYSAEVISVPSDYTTDGLSTQTITIDSAAVIQKIFEVSKSDHSTDTEQATGSLNVYVRDAQTNATISGVKVELYDPNGNLVTLPDGNTYMTTDGTGYTTTTATGLTIDSSQNYTVKVTGVPTGYIVPTTTTPQAIYSSSLHTVPIYLQKEATGSIQATITDDRYNDPIPGTSIQIIDENGNILQTLATNAEGKTDVSMPLPLNKTYTVKVVDVPDGTSPSVHAHPIPVSKTVTLTEVEPNVVVPFVTSPDPHGSLVVQILDKNTGLPIKDATVEVKNKSGIVIETITTDANGFTTEIKNLMITDPTETDPSKEYPYTVTVTSVPKGYTAPGQITVEIPSATKVEKTLEVAQAGSFIPTIVDSNTGEKIQGASVTVKGTYSDGTTFEITDITDENGQIPVIENIKVSTTTEKSNVTVIVNSVPPGYNKPTDEVVEINDNSKTIEKTLEVAKKTGSLQATIIDENTKEKIKDAYVTITNQKNEIVYEGKTDENGQTPVINDLPILEDYKIHTNSVPHGYTPPADYTARVENETPMTTVTLEVKTSTDETNKGSLQATIIDKNTKDPIKDATVEIKDSTGKVIATGKTDKDGKTPVISGLTINNTYTVHTSSVPDGYTAPGDQDITIKDGELTTVDLTVAKTTPDTGSLQAVITDKNTKEPIANATVEIKDGAGNIIVTVKTDKDGLTPIVSNLTIGTTYTIHVIEVPSGYTAPDDKSQLIASATLFKVELVVAKSADTTVQTGDNTNPFGVGMVGILSLMAFIVLVSKKREA